MFSVVERAEGGSDLIIAVRNISDIEFGQGNTFQRQIHTALQRQAWRANAMGLEQG